MDNGSTFMLPASLVKGIQAQAVADYLEAGAR